MYFILLFVTITVPSSIFIYSNIYNLETHLYDSWFKNLWERVKIKYPNIEWTAGILLINDLTTIWRDTYKKYVEYKDIVLDYNSPDVWDITKFIVIDTLPFLIFYCIIILVFWVVLIKLIYYSKLTWLV